MGLMKEFLDFLKEYKIVGLAVAFIMGVALTALVQSLVNDVVMGFVTPLIPGGNWQNATATIGPAVVRWGSFLSAMINFVIIALVVFLIVKMVMKEDKVAKQ